MATESGSGTLAGNAHQESFERLCAASARSISECINRQFCRRILRDAFPDSPQLASFSLAPEKEDDRAAQAQIIATLSSAGFRPSAETVSELIGFEVQPVAPSQPATPFSLSPGLPPITNSSAPQAPNFPIRNSKLVTRNSEDSSSPLTPSEIAALQSLSKGLAPAQLEQDADTIFSALADAISPSEEETDEEEETAEGEEAVIENFIHPNGKECKAVTRRCTYKMKGGRASKGNPRSRKNKSNTPLKAAPGAKPQAKVDAIEHALRTTLKKGGKVEDVAKIGGESVTIEHGKPGIKKLDYQRGFGSSHQYAKHGDETKEKTTPRKAAKTLVHGKRRWDEEHGTVAHELGSRAAYTRPLKDGKSTFQSAHRTD